MFPYNEKLWTVHPDEVSAHWCERFVPKPSWEQVIEGAIGMSQQALGYNAFFRYPKQGGIESMVRAFVSKLQGPIWTKTRPVRIDQRRRLVELDNGETIAYRHLVSSAAMTHLVRMMDNPPAEVTEAAARLRATTVVYYNMAVKYYGAPNSHWIYYPEKKYPFYRVGSFSSVHPSLAPPGGISLYVETAHGKADVDPMSLWPAILEGLIEAKILRGADDIVFCSPGTIPNAYVIFDNNFEAATAAISGYCDAHEINSTGRFGKWTYSSMEDSILWGVEAAERARKAAPRPETDTP
ncbi:MAG: hypothetical protein GMKNLPBB_01878 [Myxococcota bacterium]|nr:hypothetical protein [Myxococcota bacterium]